NGREQSDPRLSLVFGGWRSSVDDPEQQPIAGNTPQRVDPGLGELDVGTHHELGDRARDIDPAARGGRGDSRRDVHGNATDVVLEQLDLADVQSSANLQPELTGTLPDG